MRPRISVVMPTHNRSNLISNAINSIKNQTIDDWELVIVDDGSDDSDITREIVKRFDDSRIRYIYEDKIGMVAARNLGNMEAKADIIALQDDDDLSMPDRLEKCLRIINTDEPVVVHGGYINMWDAQYSCIGRKYFPPITNDNLLEGQIYPGVVVFMRDVWEKKPFRYETQFAFDYMMHLDWVLSGVKYQFIHEGLYEYVRQQNSASITYERDGRRKQAMDLIRDIVKKEYA